MSKRFRICQYCIKLSQSKLELLSLFIRHTDTISNKDTMAFLFFVVAISQWWLVYSYYQILPSKFHAYSIFKPLQYRTCNTIRLKKYKLDHQHDFIPSNSLLTLNLSSKDFTDIKTTFNSISTVTIHPMEKEVMELCERNEPGDAEKAEIKLLKYISQHEKKMTSASITSLYNSILNAYLLRQKYQQSSISSYLVKYYSNRSERLLWKMIKYDRSNVNTESFHIVMETLSISAGEKSTPMNDIIEYGGRKDVDDNDNDLEIVGGIDAAKRISILLKIMNKWDTYKANKIHSDANMISDAENEILEERQNQVRPNVHTYNLLMEAWARTSDDSSIQRVRDLYQRLREIYDESSSNTKDSIWKPNIRSFNSILMAWSKKRTTKANQLDKAAIRAEELLNNMWISYETSIDEQNVIGNDMKEKENFFIPVRPDLNSYLYCMEAWAESQTNEKACDNVKRLMLNLIEKQKIYPDMKPNVHIYNAMINAWSKNKKNANAPKNAQQIFELMKKQQRLDDFDTIDESIHPNTKTYNKLISTWSRAEHQGGNALYAQKLLHEMEQKYESAIGKKNYNTIRPNIRAYTSVMSAWARSRDNDKAERASFLLNRMIEKSSSSLLVIDHDDIDDISAQIILKDSNNLVPDTACYNAVLNAAALSGLFGESEIENEEVKKKAFAIAVSTFYKLCNENPQNENDLSNHDKENFANISKVSPDHISYGTFLKCIANLMFSEKSNKNTISKHKLIEQVFLKCCRDGQVGAIVLQQLRNACSDNKGLYEFILFRALESLNGEQITRFDKRSLTSIGIDELPKEWTENVKEGRKIMIAKKA